jgi:membrane fusion protein, multidrug efflux system
MNSRVRIIAPLLACALTAAGCKQEMEQPQPVRPVLSTVVEPTPAPNSVFVGTVEPRFKTDLAFRVMGRMVARPVNVGDSVADGQIVAVIDSVPLELAVRAARAELSNAQAQFATASATEDRKRKLIVTDATSRQTLDDAEQARAGVEASVAHAQAKLAKALEQLGYSQVKTDFAGVITAVSADVGQVVAPGHTVVTVARPDVREALVDISADFPVPLRVGLPFTISLELFPTVQVEGRIREIAPQADPVTRTYRVRIALRDPPPSFRLGSTVTVKIRTDQSSTLRLSPSSILAKDGETFVWVVELPASTVSLHKVDVVMDAAGALVNGGLAAGTRVVTAGIHSLTPGQQVRIQQEDAP